MSEPHKARRTGWIVFAIAQFTAFSACIYYAVQSNAVSLDLFLIGVGISIAGMIYILVVAASEVGAPGKSSG